MSNKLLITTGYMGSGSSALPICYLNTRTFNATTVLSNMYFFIVLTEYLILKTSFLLEIMPSEVMKHYIPFY